VELQLFEVVGDAVQSLVPTDLGDLHTRAHRYGVKVWFGGVTPTREHYEAQVVNPRHVPDASVLAIEIGWHAEHRNEADNDAALALRQRSQKRWRKALGDEAVAGAFLGADHWRRISETWPDPDLGDPDLAMEVALRLADYVLALEPLGRKPVGRAATR
jgi:hypothetical protein